MAAYNLIATTTVGSGGASTISFASIPQTYTDLLIVVSARGNASATVDSLRLKFNNSTSNFSSRLLFGSGSAPGFGSYSFGLAGDMNASNATASIFSSHSVYIPNYAGSTFKSCSVDCVQENNITESYQEMVAVLWSDTSAITSIQLYPGTSTLILQYSSASLYGIKNS